jgi:hypothetical protein
LDAACDVSFKTDMLDLRVLIRSNRKQHISS